MGMVIRYNLAHPLVERVEYNSEEMELDVILRDKDTIPLFHKDIREWMTEAMRMNVEDVDAVIDISYHSFMRNLVRFSVFK